MEPTNTPQVPTRETPAAPAPKQVNYILPAAILVAAILISGSILATGGVTGGRRVLPSNTNTPPAAPLGSDINAIKPISKSDRIRGNADAQVIIVEFSDTECPFCKVFHETMKKLMDEYGSSGKLAWVYRHFPIDGLHSRARAEAEAVECAGVVGGDNGYWSYLDEIFLRTNSNNTLNPLELPKIAKDIGLDLSAFEKCVSSKETAKKVSADGLDAVNSGAQGTPYSVLIVQKSGKKIPISGALPYGEVKQMIDSALLGK